MQNNENIKILILDEEKSIRMSLEFLLKDRGFKAESASDVASAVNIISGKAFDLAIVDLKLKGESGEDFILESNKIAPSMKYIVYTGYNDYKVSDRLRHLGLTNKNVLIKPVLDIELMINMIYNLIG